MAATKTSVRRRMFRSSTRRDPVDARFAQGAGRLLAGFMRTARGRGPTAISGASAETPYGRVRPPNGSNRVPAAALIRVVISLLVFFVFILIGPMGMRGVIGSNPKIMGDLARGPPGASPLLNDARHRHLDRIHCRGLRVLA